MRNLEFSPARMDEVSDLAENIREIDRIEIAGMSGLSPEEGIKNALDKSSTSYMVHDQYGRVLCMFGVGPLGSLAGGRGSPWFIGTDLVDRHRSAMLRLSPPYIAEFRKSYPVMANMVHNNNYKSIAWLRRIGFTIEAPQPVGRDGSLYRLFHMGVKNV